MKLRLECDLHLINNKKIAKSIKFTGISDRNDKLRFGLEGDPKYYSYSDFQVRLSTIQLVDDPFCFYLINIESGEKTPVCYDLLSRCPKYEDKVQSISFPINLDEHLKKIGL